MFLRMQCCPWFSTLAGEERSGDFHLTLAPVMVPDRRSENHMGMWPVVRDVYPSICSSKDEADRS